LGLGSASVLTRSSGRALFIYLTNAISYKKINSFCTQ